MEFTSRQVTLGVGALIILVLAGGWYLGHHQTGETPVSVPPVSGTTTPEASSTVSAPVSETKSNTPPVTPHKTSVNPIPVDANDTILSWNLSGAPYATGSKDAEIASMSAKLAAGTIPAYDTYIATGQDYELTGDGKDAYTNYVLAAETDSSRGLAFADVAELMEKLGALRTAKEAFTKAVAKEPTEAFFQLSYLQFLTAHAPTDAGTATAFLNAKRALGATPDLLINEAEWLGGIGSTTAAIADWEAVRPQVSAAQQAAIDATIAKLKSGANS